MILAFSHPQFLLFMRRTHGIGRQLLCALIFALILSSPIAWAGITAALGPHSPLSSDGTYIYGVTGEGRTILQRPITMTRSEWVPIIDRLPVSRITGIACEGRSLFIAAAEPPSVYRLDLESKRLESLWQGLPLLTPNDIAVLEGTIFVADVDAIYRLSALGEKPVPLVNREEHLFSKGPFYLATYDSGLVISSPGNRLIVQIDRKELLQPSKYSILQRFSPYREAIARGTGNKLPDVANTKAFVIQSPASIAVYRGIVYVIDEGDYGIYAFSRSARQPVRLVQKDALAKAPSRILVTSDRLFILDSATAHLLEWPRLIPAEIRTDACKNDAVVALYEYLFDRNVLPVREVKLRDTVDETLQGEHVLVGPCDADTSRLLCRLNPLLCMRSTPSAMPGTSLLVPDVPVQSFINIRKITLNGKTTLGEEADRNVFSKELRPWTEEAKLLELNSAAVPVSKKPGKAPGIQKRFNVRRLRTGDVSVPIELVRYLAAVPAPDLSPGRQTSPLAQLQRRFPTLTVISSEERLPLAYAALQGGGQSSDFDRVKDAFLKLKETINYYHPDLKAPKIPVIGVAEKEIECDSPDLQDSCQLISQETFPTEASISNVQLPLVFTIRGYEPSDHGTAVAALIGARSTKVGVTGLAAPEANLLSLRTGNPAVGEDIRNAYVNYHARIFNFSFGYLAEETPDILRTYVDQDSRDAYQDALFIVAAGNEGKEICTNYQVFPACWGKQPNVLVVTGATNDGKALIADSSNHNPTYVHVAAPGEGYSFTGRSRSYVPLEGSSFATPLVTATAALLYAQNVTEPWLIKQRIIATSDAKTNFSGKVMGGLLNVRRAVSYPNRAVITTSDGNSRAVYIDPSATVTIVSAQESRIILLRNVRRLTRMQDKAYRLLYVEGNDRNLKTMESAGYAALKDWNFRYREVDEKLIPTGKKLSSNLSQLDDFVGPITE